MVVLMIARRLFLPVALGIIVFFIIPLIEATSLDHYLWIVVLRVTGASMAALFTCLRFRLRRSKDIELLAALESIGFLLPRSSRERVFTPAYEERKEIYLNQRVRASWKRCLAFLLILRTVILVLDCYRVFLLDLVPILRRW
jgi:hypothetical protein